jgi:predicted nucleotidyltransferase component of viral defense system
MNTVAQLPADERAELFRETAARRGGVAFQIIEKDFWVCWTLKQLFDLPDIGTHLIFKGGTSLSKVFNAIQRFSEDIDVSISRDYLGFSGENDPENIEGSNKRKKQIESLQDACVEKIKSELLPALTEAFTRILGEPGEEGSATEWSLLIDENDYQTILFAYPRDRYSRSLAGGNYIKPVVRIELGARADHYPAETYPITPYAAEEFPAYFEEPEYSLKVLAAERTFWEKATILHEQANRTEEKGSAERISRHYYDLYKLRQETSIANEAVNDLELLARVVEHKSIFFKQPSAHYDECLKGNMQLIPSDNRKSVLAQDYEKMRDMFFGDIPDFDDILKSLEDLEKAINDKVAGYDFERK